jgi:hypothetical protein
LPGHVERDCKVIICSRCGVFGHTTGDCCIVGGGGWNVSSSGSWIGQPFVQSGLPFCPAKQQLV